MHMHDMRVLCDHGGEAVAVATGGSGLEESHWQSE